MAAAETHRLTRQIVIAMLAVTMSGTRGRHVLNFFADLDVVFMHMVEWIMRLAPYGVFALITRSFAPQGPDLLLPPAACFLTPTAPPAIQLFVTYPLLLRLLGSLNPLALLKKMRDPAAFAFSTASSGATIPVTLHTVEHRRRPSARYVPHRMQVTGDCAVGRIVAKSENALDQAVFDDPAAGSVEAATRPARPSPPDP